MRAWAIDAFGSVGSMRDLRALEPGPGEVRVRVAAAGVNPVDQAVVQGYLKDFMEHRFPLVPGSDGSGVVEALGEGVTEWSVGDEVFGVTGKPYFGAGTFAEVTTMSAGSIARRPSSLSRREAAAVPLAGGTALAMLDALGLHPGSTLLVIGATGGVGTFLVQLAARERIDVVAMSRTDHADLARSLGAAEVIDYTGEDVAAALRSGHPEGIDGIADLHGDREQLARLAEQVRQGGGVASAVGAADEAALSARGIRAANVAGMVTTAGLARLAGMLDAGEIRRPELTAFPLADARKALEAVATGHTTGKIVLEVS